eukprot:3730715-Alexandrium_andersonii.AAC.1
MPLFMPPSSAMEDTIPTSESNMEGSSWTMPASVQDALERISSKDWASLVTLDETCDKSKDAEEDCCEDLSSARSSSACSTSRSARVLCSSATWKCFIAFACFTRAVARHCIASSTIRWWGFPVLAILRHCLISSSSATAREDESQT